MQATLEILLAGDMFGAASWQATIGRRHAEQQVVDQRALHTHVRWVQPLATRLVGEAVVRHQLLVPRVVLIVVIHHAYEVVSLAQRRVVERAHQKLQHRFHIALVVFIGHRLPRLVGGGISQGPDIHQVLFRHVFRSRSKGHARH